MTDRKKVIKGLEYCKHTDGVECPNCPYWHEDDCVEILHADTISLLKEQNGLMLALEQSNAVNEYLNAEVERLNGLLKEQEAVKPILVREGRNKYYNDYVCPHCDNNVVYEQNYCSECGVQFLWERR